MSVLVILGVWVVVSAAFAPLVGHLLAGRRPVDRRTEPEYGLKLHTNSRPRP